jgi:hypothetical protein
VRSWRYLPAFFVQALRSASQAAKAEGNLVTRLLRDQRNTFWTITIWDNPEMMRAFMLTGVHRQVMDKLAAWCDEAALVHWMQDGAEIPTWEEGYNRLKNQGRPSRVNRPSPSHLARDFPKPRPGPRAELRLR